MKRKMLKAAGVLCLFTVLCMGMTGCAGKENEQPLEEMTVAQARQYMAEGQFEEGTMLPKIEAAITYLSANPQGEVLITSMDALKDALKEKNGTKITL